MLRVNAYSTTHAKCARVFIGIFAQWTMAKRPWAVPFAASIHFCKYGKKHRRKMFGTGNELETTHWFWVDGSQASILNYCCGNDLKFRCGVYEDSCLWFKYYTHKGICQPKEYQRPFGWKCTTETNMKTCKSKFEPSVTPSHHTKLSNLLI